MNILIFSISLFFIIFSIEKIYFKCGNLDFPKCTHKDNSDSDNPVFTLTKWKDNKTYWDIHFGD